MVLVLGLRVIVRSVTYGVEIITEKRVKSRVLSLPFIILDAAGVHYFGMPRFWFWQQQYMVRCLSRRPSIRYASSQVPHAACKLSRNTEVQTLNRERSCLPNKVHAMHFVVVGE